MAKFMLITIRLMAEITDADALRDAALKDFDTADMTSPDYPDTAGLARIGGRPGEAPPDRHPGQGRPEPVRC